MKFSIRDLLLVTVIAAILVAWWLDHRRLNDKIRQLNAPIDFSFTLPANFSAPVTKLPGNQMP